MAELRYACGTCGTWTCDRCGWKRSGASVAYLNHTCGRCPGRTGSIVPTMHTERMWWPHNDATELPFGYPYGQRPEGGLQQPFGPREAAVRCESYRNIPMPRTGPYGRTDLASWKRGVDEALGAIGADANRDYVLTLLRNGRAADLMDAYSTHTQSCAYVFGIIDHVAAEGSSITAQQFARSLQEEAAK